MPENLITIIGFGSLLSEESARRTCPTLRNFRRGHVKGYTRMFTKVDPNCDQFNHSRIANWAFFEAEDHKTLVTLFEIPEEEYPAFVARELDYELRSIKFTDEQTGQHGQGVACCGFRDNAAFLAYLEKNPVQKDHYHTKLKYKYNGPVWRDDILPRNQYLAFVLNAAKMHGAHYVENILRESYLADRVTTLKDYLRGEHQTLEHVSELKWLSEYL